MNLGRQRLLVIRSGRGQFLPRISQRDGERFRDLVSKYKYSQPQFVSGSGANWPVNFGFDIRPGGSARLSF
jgi:hypothetical protein